MANFLTYFSTAFNALTTKVENNFTWCKTKINALLTDVATRALNTDLTTHTGNTTVHITADERTTWNGKQDALTATQIANINAVSNKADTATTLSGYGIGDAYTKTEVDSAIANAGHLKRTIVTTVPTGDEADSNTIYMVLKSSGEDGNKYDEYMVVDGVVEKMGSTDVDLTDYATKDELDTELSSIVSGVTLTDLSATTTE